MTPWIAWFLTSYGTSRGRGKGDRTKSFTSQRFQNAVMLLGTNDINSSNDLIKRSIYHSYMERWLKVFRRRQFLIVKSEDFLENPVPVLQSIEDFLFLEKRITNDSVYYNTTRGFYCSNIEGEATCLRDRKGRAHPDIEPWIIQKLRDFYAPYNQMLYKLIDRDMGWNT